MAPTQLQIKTNVLGRLVKEEKLYRKEAQEQKAKIQQMERSGADYYTIKKMKEVLVETEQMIPQMRSRIAVALDNLKRMVNERTDEDTKLAHDHIKAAESLLA